MSASTKSAALSVYDQALALAATEYDARGGSAGGIDDQIADWVLEKKLNQSERYAWKVGDGAYVKRESEKAVLVANNSDYGEVSFWMPKSWLQSPEKVRESAIREQARFHVNANYSAYLKQVASDAGVKLGSTRKTAKVQEKLSKKGVSFMTRDDFNTYSGYRVISGNIIWT